MSVTSLFLYNINCYFKCHYNCKIIVFKNVFVFFFSVSLYFILEIKQPYSSYTCIIHIFYSNTMFFLNFTNNLHVQHYIHECKYSAFSKRHDTVETNVLKA